MDFIVDIKTVAGRAHVGANTAAETTHGFLIPERGVPHPFQFRGDFFQVVNLSFYLFFGFCLQFLELFFVRSSGLCEEVFGVVKEFVPVFCQRLDIVFISQICEENVQSPG